MIGDDKINQNQFFNLISSNELSWQSIIYDLIKTEQLDPWDINLATLAEKYVATIQQLEEADFFISSKILLACSLLLRLKSEILINSYIQDLNDALYGKKDEKRYELERIEIDENDLPILSPKTPMARHKKVTLQELIKALDHAINTESRRIRKEIHGRQARKSMLTVMPKDNFIPLKVRIKSIFGIVKTHLNDNDHMKFHHMAQSKEEQLASFVPILHLSNNGKIFLRQPKHFDHIHMTLDLHKEEKIELEEELGILKDEIIETQQ
ncbi:segregation/condensation protein A [archaeon]|jgi:segregation and condensation protein A|nr:segregation/condensation protein A [archaeon]MBT7128669.1 segregation/condensation protein A [archaeon]